MPFQQLPLAVNLKDEFDFKSFFFASVNSELEAGIRLWMSGKNESFLYLWSPVAVGKTHLLQAISQALSEGGQRVCYIPMTDFINYPAEALEGLELFDFICIDDIHVVGESDAWQQAVFHFFNRLTLAGSRLIITADCPPSELKLSLADLKTRLGSGLIYAIKDLDDEEKKRVFKQRAIYRGFELLDDGVDYIFKRVKRDMSALMQFLDHLDKSSLVAQRKLTIPFIKTILDQKQSNN